MRYLAIDDEELEAIIDFQRSMIEGAEESGEQEEAKQRRSRMNALRAIANNPAAGRNPQKLSAAR